MIQFESLIPGIFTHTTADPEVATSGLIGIANYAILSRGTMLPQVRGKYLTVWDTPPQAVIPSTEYGFNPGFFPHNLTLYEPGIQYPLDLALPESSNVRDKARVHGRESLRYLPESMCLACIPFESIVPQLWHIVNGVKKSLMDEGLIRENLSSSITEEHLRIAESPNNVADLLACLFIEAVLAHVANDHEPNITELLKIKPDSPGTIVMHESLINHALNLLTP